MKRKSIHSDVFAALLAMILLLSLFVSCVRTRSLGRTAGNRRHRLNTALPWDSTAKKRDHHHHLNSVDECCPSVTELIKPLGGVSRTGKIYELYRDNNSTQSFYQTSCEEGVKGRSCRYIDHEKYPHSMCIQKYTYTYALVREFFSQEPWRLDYIRVRSGCSCEVKVRGEHLYGWKRKRFEDII